MRTINWATVANPASGVRNVVESILTVDCFPPKVIDQDTFAAFNAHSPAAAISNDDSAEPDASGVPVLRWTGQTRKNASRIGEFPIIRLDVLEPNARRERGQGEVHEYRA